MLKTNSGQSLIACISTNSAKTLYSVFSVSFSVMSKPECFNYTKLDDQNRNINYSGGSVLCDRGISTGWYRFVGDAGNQMSTTCIPNGWKCSTHATGYLNGAHPSVSEGKVTRQVCFGWSGGCCTFRKNIEVINCSGSFYIYKLVPTGTCSLRYCGADV